MFAAFLSGLSRSSSPRPVKRPPGFRPQLTRLEDRTLPSTFTVMNLNDGGPSSLRAAIATRRRPITFAKHLHGTITLTSGELLITNSVTIDGPGADRLSVSGSDASRVFEIATGLDVAISGLTITDGFASDQGGGILNQGSNLTLSADVLSDNVAFGSATTGGRGGGLRSLAGTLTITDCAINDNQAVGGTSAVGDALVAASTSWPAVPRSATAPSAATWPGERTTAAPCAPASRS